MLFNIKVNSLLRSNISVLDVFFFTFVAIYMYLVSALAKAFFCRFYCILSFSICTQRTVKGNHTYLWIEKHELVQLYDTENSCSNGYQLLRVQVYNDIRLL